VVATTLFRVLQEATANVMRHAAASRVGVILDVKDQEVRMIVEDDGKGFAADPTCPGFVPTRQLGLVGMRERLALVGGALEVESAPDCGTTLYVRIPLEQRHAAS
jgi:signal transduction histidine kinase